MSNHKSFRSILLGWDQRNNAKAKKAEKAEKRKYIFEFNRIGIKARVEADREYLIIGTLVFLMGLFVFSFGLLYLIGVILYAR